MNIITKLKLRLNKHFGVEYFAKSAYGFRIIANYDMTGKINLNGSHSKVIENCVKELSPGDCFVDIGANAGVFSLMASKQVKQTGAVVSFEPNPNVYRILLKNILKNNAQNIMPFKTGVSSTDEIVQFTYNPRHNGMGHILAGAKKSESDENHLLEIVTLGGSSLGFLNLLSERYQKVIIKIDTEGAELKALRGLHLLLEVKGVHKVIVELDESHLNRYGDSIKDVYHYMAQYGYIGLINDEKSSHYDEIFALNPSTQKGK